MRKPIVSKASVWKVMALGAGIGLAMLSYPVHAAPASGGDTVQGLYEALLTTMKNGRILGQSGRFAQLEPVIRRTFDIPAMARLSVGPSWASLAEAQRQQVTESFARYISAIYADRFDSYSGQKLQVTGEQPAPAGVRVKSQIVKANGEPVQIDYMMRRNGESWLISDIYLDGAISEVATRRSEFAAILKNAGIDGLIAALNRKAGIPTATTAKASYWAHAFLLGQCGKRDALAEDECGIEPARPEQQLDQTRIGFCCGERVGPIDQHRDLPPAAAQPYPPGQDLGCARRWLSCAIK